MAKLPDLLLVGKLKGLTTKCAKDSCEEVVVTLQYEALREADEAKEYLGLGAVFQGEEIDARIVTATTEFSRTVQAAELSGMTAKVSAEDSTVIRLTWGVEALATLEEMFRLYSDFLAQRGEIHQVAGFLRQPRLPLVDVELRTGGEAA